MKRILGFLLCAMLVVSLGGCTEKQINEAFDVANAVLSESDQKAIDEHSDTDVSVENDEDLKDFVDSNNAAEDDSIDSGEALEEELAISSEESDSPQEENSEIQSDDNGQKAEEYREFSSVKELENTENFNKHALEHIFYGQINSRGKATGYHTESIPNEHGHAVADSETKPNKAGVYEAKVEVDGVKKGGNNGKSTFYPKDWDAQTVVDAINEAYDNRQFVKGSDNVYRGVAKDDIVIEMYLTDNDKIISAFPIY